MEELERLIKTIEDDGYIDVSESDSYYEDTTQYGLILKYLRQNKQLKEQKDKQFIEYVKKCEQLQEKLEKIKTICLKEDMFPSYYAGILQIIESRDE